MDTNKLDVDALFKQYTIKEIQSIELQIKNEIEFVEKLFSFFHIIFSFKLRLIL